MVRRGARRCAAIFLAVLAIVLLTPSAASAHATIVSSDPESGSTVPAAPGAITLSFNEPVRPAAGGIEVFDPSGAKVTAGPASTEPGNRMKVGLKPGLPPGTYTVSWRVVSADSHPVAAAFTFNLGKASATSVRLDEGGGGSTDRALGLLLGVFRWLAFGSFALLVGAAVFLFACWPRGTGVRRTRRLLLGSAVALAAATLGELLAFGPYAAGRSVGGLAQLGLLEETVGSRLGAALLIRLALLAAVGGLLWWLLARMATASRRERLVAGAGGVLAGAGIAATWSISGHASTGRQTALAMPVDIAHLLAMGTWLGGLTVLAVVLLARSGDDQATPAAAMSGEPGDPGDASAGGTGGDASGAESASDASDGGEPAGDSVPDDLEPAVARFSRLAFGCVAALVVTGGYQAWRQAGGLDALTGTEYGKTLVVKLGIFAGLVGLAYITRGVLRYQFREEGGVRLLRRMVAAEAAVALAILAVTAALVNAQPARDAYAAEQTAARGGSSVLNRTLPWDSGNTRGGKGSVALTMSPTRVGKNSMRVVVLDEKGQPRQVGLVRVILANPSRGIDSLPAKVFPGRRTGEYFVSDMEVPLQGTWTVRLLVRTTDIDEAFLSTKVSIS